MKRIPDKFLCILTLTSLLTGCWDFQDINRRSVTISVGVDSVNNNAIEYSGENARMIPSQSTGNNSQSPQSSLGISTFSDVSGKTFEDARENYTLQTPFPDFLGAVRVLVFGKNFAQQGIEAYVNRINRIFGYRKSLPLVVSEQHPTEFLGTNVKNNISAGFSIESTLDHLHSEGTAVYPKIADIVSDMAFGNIGFVLPYVGKRNDSIVLLGYAVFKEEKMIDILDIQESKGLVYILGVNPLRVEAIHQPSKENNMLSTRTLLKKRKIITSYKNGKVNIEFKAKAEIQIQFLYNVEPLTDDDKKTLEDIITQRIKREIASFVIKSQKEYKSDIFGFAKYFRADNPNIYKKINWKDTYPDANFSVDIKSKVVNINLFDPNAKDFFKEQK